MVEFTNPTLGITITLDMSDLWHPKRTSENGDVKQAGANHEVWVDFAWKGPFAGDFFRPFNMIASAVAALPDGGVVRMMPGTTRETPIVHHRKKITLIAPIGGVTFGHHPTKVSQREPHHVHNRNSDEPFTSPR